MRWRISRRDFLLLAAAGAAACHRKSDSPTTSASPSTSAPAPVLPTTKTLPAAEARTLDAVTSRILPSEDGPGAREVNAVGFIDRQVSSGDLAPLGAALVACARIFDSEAQRRYTSAFVDLDASRQDAIVSDFAQAKLSVAFPQREAFGLLHMLTLEALLSDPVHGGNVDMTGWKWIRFPTPTLRTPGEHEHHH